MTFWTDTWIEEILSSSRWTLTQCTWRFRAQKIDKIVKPKLWEKYHNRGKAEFLSTMKYHDRTPCLFKAEFQGTRMISLMSKCYYAENAKSKPKFSCKGISKKQNPMSWERYLEALNGSIDRANNTGFQLDGSGIVTYNQSK